MKKTTYIFALSLILAAALMFSCGGGGGGGVDDAINDTAFTIGYNANGAESGSAPAAQSGNGKEVLSVSANTGSLAKGGYLFDGWNTSADGSGADYAPGALHNGKNLTLYAKWARLFDYDPNAVSPAPALNGVQNVSGVSTATITGLTPRGSQLSSVIIPGSMDGYTISGIGNNAFRDCDNITDITIPDTVTTIGNNAFAECSNLLDMTLLGTAPPVMGAGVFYNCSVIISVPQVAVGTYQGYAGWTAYSTSIVYIGASTYSINYNGNGSDGGIVPLQQVSLTGGYPLEVYGNTGNLTRAGCTFNGWNTSPDGNGNNFNPGDHFSGPGRLTLYAKWYHPDYVVTFDSQDADTNASPESVIIKAPANTIGALPAEPKKTGYRFAGWYTAPDGGGTQFATGSSVVGNMTVYAKWSANLCTVVFNGNNPTSGSVPENHTALSGQSIVLPSNIGNLIRTGCTFGGWNTKADGTGTNYAEGANYTIKGDIIFYAKWNVNSYAVTYNRNSATSGNAPNRQTALYGQTITLQTKGELKRTGYYFSGWNTKADGTGTNYAEGESYIVNGNITLYAKWLEWTYTSKPGSRYNAGIGDIVLSDGKTVTSEIYTTYYNKIIAEDGAPVGVVAYKGGTSLKLYAETFTAGTKGKIYMIGLNEASPLKWATHGTTGYITEFNTSDSIGEGNWAVIQAADSSGAAMASINYPAFNYADTYSVTGYTSGWFLPSAEELKIIYSKKDIINTGITAAGGTALGNGYTWSSSQSHAYSYEGDVGWASVVYFNDGSIHSLPKADNRIARVVRSMD